MKRVTLMLCAATIGIFAACAPAGDPTPPALFLGAGEGATAIVDPADDPCAPWLDQGVGCEYVSFPAMEIVPEGAEGPRG